MADSAQSLLSKYQVDNDGVADMRQTIIDMQAPQWSKFPATSEYEQLLDSLRPGQDSQESKMAFTTQSVKACMAAMGIKDEAAPLQYVLTFIYDLLREDGSVYSTFEEAAKNGCSISKPLMGLLDRTSSDANWTYVADKAAWLLSSLMAHMPKFFAEAEVQSLVSVLLSGARASDLGVLEAITNLLKGGSYRELVWSQSGVASLVFKVNKESPSAIVYKSVFAIWMVSFDSALMQGLRSSGVIQKIKDILAFSRTEKVIRLCLTVLRNFLAQKKECKAICEDIVEEGLMESVQQLEYEKWRDAELYDDIKELIQLIGAEMKELSNFDRYMKELDSGALSWGFIHSSKFFGENVMKFESGEFKAVKLLAGLLASNNAVTLAVACHDIGEFVSLHPMGKKQVARLGVKERVMELMASTDPDFREVRREALLCCQKLMLNKWQDAAQAEKK